MGMKASSLLAAAAIAMAGGLAQASIIQFDAESGTLGSDFTTTAVTGALGGNVIQVATGTSDANDIASYDVNFADTGSYDLYMRWVVASSGSHDSFYVGTQFGQLSTGSSDFPGSDKAELNGLQIDGAGAHEAKNATVVGGGVYSNYKPGDIVWVDLTSNWDENIGANNPAGNGEVPAFNVAAPGTLTWQAAGREAGLQVDAFAFVTSGQAVTKDGSGNLMAVPVTPTVVNWTGPATGDYGVATNWDSGSVPDGTDIVHINNGTSGVVTLGQDASVWQLAVGSDNGQSGSLAVGPNSTLNILADSSDETGAAFQIGNGALQSGSNTSASVALDSSTVNAVNGGSLWVGEGYATGSLTMTDSAYNTNGGWIAVGREGGNGTMTTTGGSITINGPGGDDSPGLVVADTVGTGNATTGKLVMTDTTVNSDDEVDFGKGVGATATVEMNGTSSLTGHSRIVFGRGGTATVTMNDNSVLTTTGGAHLNIGQFDDGAQGHLIMNDNSVLNLGDQLRIGRDVTTGTMEMNGSSKATVAATTELGRRGSGTLTMNDNSTFTQNNGDFVVGVQGGTGTFTLNSDAVFTKNGGNFIIGQDGGTGTVTANGSATLNTRELRLGQDAGSTGTLVLNPGTTMNINGWISIGRAGTGTITLNDATINETGGNVAVGDIQDDHAVGTFNLNGDSHVHTTGETQVGDGTDGTGTMTMTGNSTWVGDKWISIGRRGKGTLIMKDNASITRGTGDGAAFIIADNVGGSPGDGSVYLYNNAKIHTEKEFWMSTTGPSTSYLEMNDQSSLVSDSYITISRSGPATVVMNNDASILETDKNFTNGDNTPNFVLGWHNSAPLGAATLTMNDNTSVEVHTGAGFIDQDSNNNATLTLNGNATFTLVDNSLRVGASEHTGNVGTGTVVVNGNAKLSAKGIYVGTGNSGWGVFNQNGGAVDAGDVLMVTSDSFWISDTDGDSDKVADKTASYSTLGLYNLNGGVLTAGYVGQAQADLGQTAATFNFNGGTLQANQDQSDFFQVAQQPGTGYGAHVLAGGANIDSNGYNVTINQVLDGSGGLTKIGQGSLTFSVAQQFTGAVHVTAGTLAVHGTANNAATVDDGGALAGDGAFASIASSGNVAPDTTGMDVAGDFSLSGAGASMSADVTSKNTYGHLTAGGAATVTGILNLTATDPTQLSLGDIMTLLSADGGVTGTFGQVTGISLGQIAGFNDALAVLYGTNDVTARVSIVGDANTDDVVNGLDLQLIANNWQGTGDTWIQGDFNGDGLVNGLDLQLLANNWQAGVGGTSQSFAQAMALYGPGTSSVPEPASAALLLAAFAGLGLGLRIRPRRQTA